MVHIMYQRSLMGVHLDNYKIELKGKDLKNFSSGEKKINLLLMFIGMITYYKKVNNEFPIFLIDDFDSVMDKKGLEFLFSNFPDLQIIATSVNKYDRFDNCIEVKKEH